MLRESKGNMYRWVSGTKNPLAGQCLHNCSYCSTNTLKRFPVIKKKYSGPIRIEEKVLKENLGSGYTWFIVGQNDLFAEGVPDNLIVRILDWCKRFPDNKYLFQSKNPGKFIDYMYQFPKDTILCTTIESNRYTKHMGFAPPPAERAYAMEFISDFTKYVTIEPIMDFDLKEMVMLIKQCNPDSVNIGFDSKWNHLPEPNEQETIELITELRKFTKVKLKSNSKRIIK